MSKALTPQFTLEDIKKANTYSFRNPDSQGDEYWDLLVRNLTCNIDLPDTLYSIYDIGAAVGFEWGVEEGEMLNSIYTNLNIDSKDIDEAYKIFQKEFYSKQSVYTDYNPENQNLIINDFDGVIKTVKTNDATQYIIPKELFAQIGKEYIIQMYSRMIERIDPLMSEEDVSEMAYKKAEFNEQFEYPIISHNSYASEEEKLPYPETEEEKIKASIIWEMENKIHHQIDDRNEWDYFKTTKPIMDRYFELAHSGMYSDQEDALNQAIVDHYAKKYPDSVFKYKIEFEYLESKNKYQVTVHRNDGIDLSVTFDNSYEINETHYPKPYGHRQSQELIYNNNKLTGYIRQYYTESDDPWPACIDAHISPQINIEKVNNEDILTIYNKGTDNPPLKTIKLN